jgi:hypothetical protein
MAYADEKPSLKSDHDVDPIASISRSFQSSGAGDAERIESQFAVFTVADELPKPSGWDDGPVLGFSGGDEITGDKVPVPARPDSRPRFPRRPQEPDCAYYLKFGTCRFGMKCKFNHPARKKNNRVGSLGLGILIKVFSFVLAPFPPIWGIFAWNFDRVLVMVSWGLVVSGWVK